MRPAGRSSGAPTAARGSDPAPGARVRIALAPTSPFSVTRELLSETGSYPDAAAEYVPQPETWSRPQTSGGGYGQAQLTHLLGIALWVTRLRGQEVFALMSAPLDAKVELHNAVAMRYTNGAIGTMSGASSHAGAANNRHAVEVRVVGSRGMFLLLIVPVAIAALHATWRTRLFVLVTTGAFIAALALNSPATCGRYLTPLAVGGAGEFVLERPRPMRRIPSPAFALELRAPHPQGLPGLLVTAPAPFERGPLTYGHLQPHRGGRGPTSV
jgi:hypothetical protein